MIGSGIHFNGMRIFPADYVTRIFDYGHLHTEADPEERNIVFAHILDRGDFAFDTALAEARGY
ncbi:hypothetical protein D3C87_1693690 [compost metagenome]